MTVNAVQRRPYDRHLHAENLSSRESLPDVKAKQKRISPGAAAEIGLDLGSQVAKKVALGAKSTALGGAGAVAAPVAAYVASLAQLSAAHTEGMELSKALQRDVVHTATLHLGRDAFGTEYGGYAEAEMRRLAGEYEGDDSSRALYGATVSRTVTAVIKAEGGDTKARAAVGDGVRDGIGFAKDRDLRTRRDLEVMKQLNPQFRFRYETDPTFHHGVNAVVWRNEQARARGAAEPS